MINDYLLLLMIRLIKLDGTYLCKVKIENTRAMHEICSKI